MICPLLLKLNRHRKMHCSHGVLIGVHGQQHKDRLIEAQPHYRLISLKKKTQKANTLELVNSKKEETTVCRKHN